MQPQELIDKLGRDLKLVGLPVEEVEIRLAKRYSKTYYGMYYPATEKYPTHMRLYPYRVKGSNLMYPYEKILGTAIHEMCHHLQYSAPDFAPKKGVVHNEEFWKLYNDYILVAKAVGVMKGYGG